MDPTPTRKQPVELLGNQHNRSAFSCGVPVLDRYLQKQASQDVKKKVAAIFVITETDGRTVIGYYALSATKVFLSDLPPDTIKKLPRYPDVPATLLGRLAVSQSHKRKGLGESLLMDALKRSYEQSRHIASAAVVVDAKDDNAVAFYSRYGFHQFPDQKDRLFLPMQTIEKTFA